MIFNLSETQSIVSEWVSELRNVHVQQDRLRFRTNLERIGNIAAYEISKYLKYKTIEIQTPLGIHASKVLTDQPVLATILRAGLPLHTGLLQVFDKADNAFISAYRKHLNDGSFEISLDYLSSPDINGRTLIIADPMLATGASLAKTIQYLKEEGDPEMIFVVCAIACSAGIENLLAICGNEIHILCGDIDEEITAKGYIVPGLGDAGDLSFGNKTQF